MAKGVTCRSKLMTAGDYSRVQTAMTLRPDIVTVGSRYVYPEPDESNQQHSVLFLRDPF